MRNVETRLARLSSTVSTLSRAPRMMLMLTHDALAMIIALWLSFSVRLGDLYLPPNAAVAGMLGLAVVAGLVSLLSLRVYRLVVRYIDNRAASTLAAGSAAAAVAWFVVAFLSGIDGIPRSIGFIYFSVLFSILYFSRVTVAFVLNLPASGMGLSLFPRRSTVNAAIYGSNDVTVGLVEALRGQPRYALRCIVVDDETLVGRMMLGIPIRSSTELASLAASGQIKHIFLAQPNLNRGERLALVSRLTSYGLEVMTLPSYDEIVSGRYTVSDVRPVNVDDLLARQTVPPLPELIEKSVNGRTVLVTGAGGSIGSEIARQAVANGARTLILLDHSEYGLFQITTELGAVAGRGCQLLPVVGSLLNAELLRHVFDEHDVDVVFHAAAYKHVPLLEHNEVVGVENNVIGTRNLADACIAAKVPRMTMISTDKAVRPTNVMGASKRVAELYVQALASRLRSPTVFGIVRFGNVLDSSGSVVQTFRDQILHGQAVTVTHPEITRFFMSIPEATQLVLQASAMAERGEVFVLDMGERIRIADLAKTMIALYGMTERTAENPEGDIPIAYVGLRPGEKLHEELFVGSVVSDTVHPQIKMAQERCLPLPEMRGLVDLLIEALSFEDAARLRALLFAIVAEDRMTCDANDNPPLISASN